MTLAANFILFEVVRHIPVAGSGHRYHIPAFQPFALTAEDLVAWPATLSY
jgi:hypothetical protein